MVFVHVLYGIENFLVAGNRGSSEHLMKPMNQRGIQLHTNMRISLQLLHDSANIQSILIAYVVNQTL